MFKNIIILHKTREQRKQQNFSDLLLDMHKNIDFF